MVVTHKCSFNSLLHHPKKSLLPYHVPSLGILGNLQLPKVPVNLRALTQALAFQKPVAICAGASVSALCVDADLGRVALVGICCTLIHICNTEIVQRMSPASSKEPGATRGANCLFVLAGR